MLFLKGGNNKTDELQGLRHNVELYCFHGMGCVFG